MKKTLAVICALLALCLTAAASAQSVCVQGSRAGAWNGEWFYVVDEGNTDALVHIKKGALTLSERVNRMSGLVPWKDALYYVRKIGGTWDLVCRKGVEAESVYTFEDAHEISCLTAVDETLFLLIDSQLHILYPEQQLCLKLADAQMSSYVIFGDYAYYISVLGTKEYALSDETGLTANAEEGCLYRLNMSTSNTSPVLKEGVRDLKLLDGKLYFHNFGQAYLQKDGERLVLAGKLCRYDIEKDQLETIPGSYDWGYALLNGKLLEHRAEGLMEVAEDGTETKLFDAPASGEFDAAGDSAVLFDPENTSITIFTPGTDPVTVLP